jgi:hypothetical protein
MSDSLTFYKDTTMQYLCLLHLVWVIGVRKTLYGCYMVLHALLDLFQSPRASLDKERPICYINKYYNLETPKSGASWLLMQKALTF